MGLLDELLSKTQTQKVLSASVADVKLADESETVGRDEYENLFKKEELTSKQENRKYRKSFGIAIFVLISFYLAAVLVLLYLTGGSCFSFSDTVLVTLLTTTTANVLGVFLIVVKYYFK